MPAAALELVAAAAEVAAAEVAAIELVMAIEDIDADEAEATIEEPREEMADEPDAVAEATAAGSIEVVAVAEAMGAVTEPVAEG